jgi:hypothetical protein
MLTLHAILRWLCPKCTGEEVEQPAEEDSLLLNSSIGKDATTCITLPLPDGTAINCEELLPAESADEVVLGGRMWEAAPHLCAFLRSVANQVKGSSLLELGAGTGACGLYAAGLGARRVVLSEGGTDAPTLLDLLHRNAARNAERGGAVEVQALHWGEDCLPTGPFEWVVGSDIVLAGGYSHVDLCATLHALLARDQCRVVLAMQHGLPVPIESAAFGTVADRFLDETLQELEEAAFDAGLALLPVENGAPIELPVKPTDRDVIFTWPADVFNAFGDSSGVYMVQVVPRMADGLSNAFDSDSEACSEGPEGG